MIRMLVLFTLLFPSIAFAQNWDVQGGKDRQKEIVKRYKTLLERTPSEGLAFKKLLDYVGKGKKLEGLVTEYRKKVEGKPDKANYRLILGHLLKAKNDYEGALVQYEKAVELTPNDPLVWMSRGSVHVLLQHMDKATGDFEKALSLEKNKDKKQDILRKLADAAFAQRDWERAQKYYDQLVSIDPKNEYLRLEYAQVLIQYKRYEKALAQYQQLLKLAGRDAKAKATTLRDTGDLYEKMGQDDKAIETYRKAQKLMKSGNWLDVELEQRIVGVYRRTDRLGELIKQYEKKWRNPNYTQAMLLGGLFDESGREDDALKMYKRAVTKNRSSVDPRIRVIRILERRGKEKEVIKAYGDLIRIAPRESRYQFDLVKLYFRLGDRKKAESLLKKIESRFSRQPDVLVVLADNYMRFDMRKKALATYKKLVRLDPRNDAFILGLGEYYYQSGEIDNAVKTWVKLLKTDLEKYEAYARLGQVLAEHGLVDKGLNYFEKAVELSPDDHNVRRGLALAYERARRWSKAIETWEFLLEKSDQPLTRNEARSRIVNLYFRQNKLRAKMREFALKFEDKSKRDFSAGFFLAAAHSKLSEYDEAERILEDVVKEMAKLTTDEAKAFELMALIDLEKLHTQTGELKKAISVLERLAKLQPVRKREYYHRIAEHSLKLYEDDQAVHYATLAVQANPDDANAQARLGDVYHRMGNLKSAATQYKQAIDIDPRAFEIQYKLAEVLLELGEYKEADRIFRTLVKKAPDEGLIARSANKSMKLAEVNGTLEEIETEFFPMVYRTPPKPIYRKIMLDIYDRLASPLADVARYGVDEDQLAASKTLSEIGQRAIPVLIDALQAKEVGQRALALRLLGDLRQGGAALAVGRLVDDSAEPLRIVAAIAVAQIGDARGAGPLVRVADDENPTMRELAVWALGGTGGEMATKKLVDILHKGRSWREQALAAISLGRIGSSTARKGLRDFYKKSQNSFTDLVTAATLWGLGRSKDAESVSLLADALKSKSKDVASVASWSLARIGGDDAARTLLSAYWSVDPAARARAGRGLTQLVTRSSNLSALEEIRAEIRLIDDRQGVVNVERILRNLEDASAVVVPGVDQKAALDLISIASGVAKSKLSDEKTRSLVLDDLACGEKRVALGVAIPCSRIAQKEIDGALFNMLKSLASDLRNSKYSVEKYPETLTLLGQIGEGSDLATLQKHAKAKSNRLRLNAARGLGHFGSKSKSVLVSLTTDSNSEVRAQASRSLALVGEKDAAVVAALKKLLTDPFLTVRIEAAQTLGVLKAQEAEQAMVTALSGAKVPFAVVLLTALSRTGGEKAQSALTRYKNHADLRLKRAAEGKRI